MGHWLGIPVGMWIAGGVLVGFVLVVKLADLFLFMVDRDAYDGSRSILRDHTDHFMRPLSDAQIDRQHKKDLKHRAKGAARYEARLARERDDAAQ